MARRYQFLPRLSAEEYAALKADITANGVRVPIERDEIWLGLFQIKAHPVGIDDLDLFDFLLVEGSARS